MQKLLFYLIVLRPLFRIFSDKIEILSDINSIGVLVLAVVILFFERKFKSMDLLCLIYIVILSAISLISAENINFAIKDPYWLIIAILMLIFARSKGILEDFRRFIVVNNKLIKWELIIINLILLLSFFDSSCYVAKWGGGKYFTSYAEGPHPLGALMILTIVITLTLSKVTKSKKIYLLLIIPSIAVLLTGARIMLVTLIALYLTIVKLDIKSFSRLTVISIIMFFFKDIFKKLPSINKFLLQSSTGDISSGRFEFWMVDIQGFLDSDLLNKFIGSGFDYPYLLNFRTRGVYIWAHNDIINLILSIGIIGLTIYLCFIIKYCIYINKNLNVFNFAAFIMFFLGSMCVNGFYNYSDFAISVSVLSVCIMSNSNINMSKNE
ncbi:O-antigen ligase family protein [Clostridium sp.]|jgi:hypothetical protein|uniref:O-antigen ligase family protein n=1 Tax=Clostridium sp. TaxID=1506 RepID=UPI003EE9CAA1